MDYGSVKKIILKKYVLHFQDHESVKRAWDEPDLYTKFFSYQTMTI